MTIKKKKLPIFHLEKRILNLPQNIKSNSQDWAEILTESDLDPEKMVKVGGFHNNYAANVMLHAFIEHWDKLDFSQPPYQELGEIFWESYALPNLGKTKMKQLIDAVPNWKHKENAFGGKIRRHMAQVLKQDHYYRDNYFFDKEVETSFLALSQYGKAKQERERLENARRVLAHSLGLAEDLVPDSAENISLEHFRKRFFEYYCDVLAEESNDILIDETQLRCYALHMQIEFGVISFSHEKIDDVLQTVITDFPAVELAYPLFKLNMLNMYNVHWQYQLDVSPEVSDYIWKREILERNRDHDNPPSEDFANIISIGQKMSRLISLIRK